MKEGSSRKSADLALQFTVEGNRLAQRLADELGDEFEVEFDSYQSDTAANRYRAAGAPVTPGAATAFSSRMESVIQEQHEFARLRADGRIYVQGSEIPTDGPG